MVLNPLKAEPDQAVDLAVWGAFTSVTQLYFAVKLGVVKKDDFGCKSILTFGNALSYPPKHVERLETNTRHLVFGFSTVPHW